MAVPDCYREPSPSAYKLWKLFDNPVRKVLKGLWGKLLARSFPHKSYNSYRFQKTSDTLESFGDVFGRIAIGGADEAFTAQSESGSGDHGNALRVE